MDVTYLYVEGKQAGFDPEAGPEKSRGRWRLKNGTFCTRQEALGEHNPGAVWGSRVGFDIAPLSTKLDNFERVVLGQLQYDRLARLEQTAHHMPVEIAASMRLSEFYLRTEGDLFTTVIVPIQLALRDVQVQSDDKAVERELAEVYEELDLRQLLLWNWLCIEQYGQSFPLEVWDSDNLAGIVMLDPKYMKVGKQVSLSNSLFLTAPEGQKWDETALKEQIHPMVYDSFGSGWNEQAAIGADIPIRNDRCFALFDFKLPFQRYAIPSLSRCFRPLSTRQILEEMQRATIEGFRNQLWLFKLAGHDGTAAPPAAIAHLKNQMGDFMGERTGAFVWGGTDLIVEVHAPESLDVLMGNEMWLALSLHIYRQRGLNLKLVTGESPQGGRASDMEWDVQIFLERLKFQRHQIMRFEKHLRRAIGQARGKNWQKAKTEVHMIKPDVELQTLVERELRPLGQAGWLSTKTILEKAGYSYEVELQRKKDEEPDEHRFLPKPTFSQGTSQMPVTTLEAPTGRPGGAKDKEKRQEVKGHTVFAQDASFDGYVHKIYDLFDPLVEEPSREAVDAFVAGMKEVNASQMMKFAADGYAIGGGAFEVDPTWIRGAINFVNSFADGFGQRLHAAVDAGRDLEGFRWNVYLYPQEGRHLGYMWGLQQAMRERGARAWRRVLHPELSETGPCTACIADSANTHPITEGFWEPHPHGVCSAQSIYFYTAEEGMPIEVPIPKRFVLPEAIRNLLERLGRLGKSVVRRFRRD